MRCPSLFLPATCLLLAGTLASGCRSFDPARARREQTESFTSNLAARAAAELAKPVPLAEDAPTSQGTIQPNAGLGALY